MLVLQIGTCRYKWVVQSQCLDIHSKAGNDQQQTVDHTYVFK